MLYISTPYGNRYRIEDNGYIVRLDQPGFRPSAGWQFLGLVPVNSTRLAVRREDITAEWLASHPLRYKNGNPRYTVRDLDHGTTRDWGNTKYHWQGTV